MKIEVPYTEEEVLRALREFKEGATEEEVAQMVEIQRALGELLREGLIQQVGIEGELFFRKNEKQATSVCNDCPNVESEICGTDKCKIVQWAFKY